jgi:hypothetical protein
MRRPHARACWRQPLICANERGVRFPGLGRADSACPARKRRGRTCQEFGFRRTERGAWRTAIAARPHARTAMRF